MWQSAVKEIRRLDIVTDTRAIIWDAYNKGQRILAEGAQGVMLDVGFGDYPMVISSHTITGGVCIVLGVPPQWIGDVYGIIKAGYVTKVGGGEFPSRMEMIQEDYWQEAGHEFGATTGRRRMCGRHDLRQLAKAIKMNGVTKLILTKADICPTGSVSIIDLDGVASHFPGWKIGVGSTKYDLLPIEFKNYVYFLEDKLDVPVVMIGTGPGREDVIVRQ